MHGSCMGACLNEDTVSTTSSHPWSITHRIALHCHSLMILGFLLSYLCALSRSLSLSISHPHRFLLARLTLSFLLVDVLHLLWLPTGCCSPELEHSCIRVIARQPD